jgi:hypothetical protein
MFVIITIMFQEALQLKDAINILSYNKQNNIRIVASCPLFLLGIFLK